MIDIDGSSFEGGGQILRIALSLSCLLQKKVRIFNIRSKRQNPGLSAQHKTGIDLMKEICDANVVGNSVGSKEIIFTPNPIRSGTFYADTRTAGSIALLLQVAMPVLYFAGQPTTLELRGGTNAAFAPQFEFLTDILLPNLEKFGLSFHYQLVKRGYYPHGGGQVGVRIIPTKLIHPAKITQFGEVKKFFGKSYVSGSLPIHIAYEMKDGVVSALKPLLRNVPINIQVRKENRQVAEHCSSGIIIGFETTSGCKVGSSGLGSRQERPFEMGAKIGRELKWYAETRACVDLYVQDQLLIFMALATGVSQIQTVAPTCHTQTAIFIIERMTNASFKIHQPSNGLWIIECTGIGLVNDQI